MILSIKPQPLQLHWHIPEESVFFTDQRSNASPLSVEANWRALASTEISAFSEVAFHLDEFSENKANSVTYRVAALDRLAALRVDQRLLLEEQQQDLTQLITSVKADALAYVNSEKSPTTISHAISFREFVSALSALRFFKAINFDEAQLIGKSVSTQLSDYTLEQKLLLFCDIAKIGYSQSHLADALLASKDFGQAASNLPSEVKTRLWSAFAIAAPHCIDLCSNATSPLYGAIQLPTIVGITDTLQRVAAMAYETKKLQLPRYEGAFKQLLSGADVRIQTDALEQLPPRTLVDFSRALANAFATQPGTIVTYGGFSLFHSISQLLTHGHLIKELSADEAESVARSFSQSYFDEPSLYFSCAKVVLDDSNLHAPSLYSGILQSYARVNLGFNNIRPADCERSERDCTALCDKLLETITPGRHLRAIALALSSVAVIGSSRNFERLGNFYLEHYSEYDFLPQNIHAQTNIYHAFLARNEIGLISKAQLKRIRPAETPDDFRVNQTNTIINDALRSDPYPRADKIIQGRDLCRYTPDFYIEYPDERKVAVVTSSIPFREYIGKVSFGKLPPRLCGQLELMRRVFAAVKCDVIFVTRSNGETKGAAVTNWLRRELNKLGI